MVIVYLSDAGFIGEKLSLYVAYVKMRYDPSARTPQGGLSANGSSLPSIVNR